MSIAPWQWWLMFAVILLFADIVVAGGASGILLLLALAAVGGMAAALLGLDPNGQMLAAMSTGAIATPFVVWKLRRVTSGSSSALTDSRVANRNFEVIRQGERVGIRIHNEFFPARHDDGRELLPGEQVKVERFEGIHAVVSAVDTSPQ